jgi:hypothetical protein
LWEDTEVECADVGEFGRPGTVHKFVIASNLIERVFLQFRNLIIGEAPSRVTKLVNRTYLSAEGCVIIHNALSVSDVFEETSLLLLLFQVPAQRIDPKTTFFQVLFRAETIQFQTFSLKGKTTTTQLCAQGTRSISVSIKNVKLTNTFPESSVLAEDTTVEVTTILKLLFAERSIEPTLSE